MPVRSAAPWPRLTGCRTTRAPAAAATAAEASRLPSSTQTTCPKTSRSPATTSPTTASSPYIGTTTHVWGNARGSTGPG